MKESLSTLSDTALSEFIRASSATIGPISAAAHGVFDRVSKFSEIHGAAGEKPGANALLYRAQGSAEVRCERLQKGMVVGRLAKSTRNPDGCDLAFPEVSEMSRRHFEIIVEAGFHLLRDLNSRNGTFLNHERAPDKTVVLKAGDIITASGIVFAYTGGEGV